MIEYKYLLDYKRRELMERLNEKTGNKDESEAIELTGFEALEILDEMNHTDGYRWHVLKNDPYDLPKNNDKVLCCTKNKKNGFLNYAIGYRTGEVWKCGQNKNVIAWKYIEPFERGMNNG